MALLKSIYNWNTGTVLAVASDAKQTGYTGENYVMFSTSDKYVHALKITLPNTISNYGNSVTPLSVAVTDISFGAVYSGFRSFACSSSVYNFYGRTTSGGNLLSNNYYNGKAQISNRILPRTVFWEPLTDQNIIYACCYDTYLVLVCGNDIGYLGDLTEVFEDVGYTLIGCEIQKTGTDTGYAYASCGSNGLFAYTFNFSTGPNNIAYTYKDTDAQGGYTYGRIYSDQTYLYVCCGTDGLLAYSFDGTTLTYITRYYDGSYFEDVAGPTSGLIAATNTDGVKILSFNGSTFTLLESKDFGGSAVRVDYDSNGLYYIANSSDGLRICQLSDGDIVIDPQDTNVYSGYTASFSAGITGAIDYYQWYKNDGAIAGATGLNYYTVPNLSNNGDQYKFRINYGDSYEDSSSATLGVYQQVSIYDDPDDATILSGYTNTFEVGATGSNLLYQWYLVDGGVTAPISGATGANYNTGTLTSLDSGKQFFVKATDMPIGGIDYSSLATLTVADISGLTGPFDQYYFAGNTVTFGVTGINPSGITVQWQKEV